MADNFLNHVIFALFFWNLMRMKLVLIYMDPKNNTKERILWERNKFVCCVSLYIMFYLIHLIYGIYYHMDLQFASGQQVAENVALTRIIVY